MAVTITRYNHTIKLCLNKEIDYSTLKVMLLTDDATFDATDIALTDVSNAGAYEVDGNGWDAGGETLQSVAISIVNTDGAMIDAADLSVEASGGNIGPAFKAVIYDDTHASDAPLWFIDFDGAQEAGVGTPFNVNISSDGLARINSAA